LKYIPQNSTAAIRYQDPVAGYRVVYLAFGFEGISGPYRDSAQKLLSRILNWLSGTTEVNQSKSGTIPKQYRLEQNYPNPFNPATKIVVQLPETDHARYKNINGPGGSTRHLPVDLGRNQ